MSFNFAPYVGFDGRCDGKAHDGTKALMAYLLDRFSFTASLGIYNCRPPSVHGDGRAGDLRIPTGPGGKARPELGMQVVNLLGPHGKRLGLCDMIYAREIWSAASPDGRYYGGVHPHYDHVHWDQTPASGSNLTYATLVAVLGPAGATPPPPTPPQANDIPWPGNPSAKFFGYNVTEFKGHFDGYVREGQRMLNLTNLDMRVLTGDPKAKEKLDEDGRYGQLTELAVKGFQGAVGLPQTGILDQPTWNKLNEVT